MFLLFGKRTYLFFVIIATFLAKASFAASCEPLSANAQALTRSIKVLIDPAYKSQGKPCLANTHLNLVGEAFGLLKNTQFKPINKSNDDSYFSELGSPADPDRFILSRYGYLTLVYQCNINVANALGIGFQQTKEVKICGNQIESAKANKRPFMASDLAAVLVHEARHLDSDDPKHTTCTSGYKKGRSASCDVSRKVRGGYHFGAELLMALGHTSTNIHPAVKMMAQSGVLISFTNDFNQMPQLNRGNFYITRNREKMVQLFDGERFAQTKTLFAQSEVYDYGDGNVFFFNRNTSKMGMWHYIGGFSRPETVIDFEKKVDYNIIDLIFNNGISRSQAFLSRKGTEYFVGINYDISFTGARLNSWISLGTEPVKRFLTPFQCGGRPEEVFVLKENGSVMKVSEVNGQLKSEDYSRCQTTYEYVVPANDGYFYLNKGQVLNHYNTEITQAKALPVILDFISAPFSVLNFFHRQ